MAGSFVWDLDGPDEYTFTFDGETHLFSEGSCTDRTVEFEEVEVDSGHFLFNFDVP